MFLPIAVLLTSVATAASALPEKGFCRCQPNKPCWPSSETWQQFNNSVNGNLLAVKPGGYVCHDPTFDVNACAEIHSQQVNSTWRTTKPGLMQWDNWAAWPEREQRCYFDDPRDEPCGQGRISPYAVDARSAEDIQSAIRFAKKNNIRIVVKSSGHDLLGRSAAPYSLLIFTHNLKNTTFTDDLVLKGSGGSSNGPAITVGPGVTLWELYDATGKRGVTVVGGGAHTVCLGGGYILGGGHSPLGPWQGMAADNALEVSVVTANGDLVTANEHENPDLFWALRGGGGGTFGVIVNATVRTFPEVPVIFATFNFTTLSINPHFWKAMEEFHAVLPEISNTGGGGYYFALPNIPALNLTTISAFSSMMFFVNQTDTAAIDKIFRPLELKMASLGIIVQFGAEPYPSFSAALTRYYEGQAGPGGVAADQTGAVWVIGSRLFSQQLFESHDGPQKFTQAVSRLQYPPNALLSGTFVFGGTVAANGQTVNNSVNPAFRNASLHLTFGRNWSVNATLADQQAVIKNLTDVEVPLLQSVEGPDKMGAYQSEANAYEPNFQQSFFGNHYDRLYRIKQNVDPDNLFIVRRGVGSENWDDDGLCRV